MDMPSNKFFSSSLAAPPSRSNTSLRNSEISNPIRRSFSGNPFPKPSVIANPRSFNPNTPANSPSDFPRRNSIGSRESVGSFGDLDDKENGKDQILKPSKVRSPAPAASTKGIKNFMSPTISASSKITESPRKKVLMERNEPARISYSSTEGKSPIRKVTFADSVEEKKFQPSSDGGIIKEETEKHMASMVSGDLKAEGKSPIRKVTFADSVEEKKFQPSSENLTASMLSEDLKPEALHSKNETESAFETVIDEPDCVNLDPTFKLSPTPPPISSTSTIIAPLDADPSVPPYDPKLNYLSPRPQFLHYKPNPRVELYKERGCMQLEDSFSDTELTEEAQSDGSEKGLCDSSDEIVSEEENYVSDSSPKGLAAKHGFLVRSKAIALLLLLSVACTSISFSNSQVFDPFLKDLNIISQTFDSSEFSQFARTNFDHFFKLAKENLDTLAQHCHLWFSKQMSSISELVLTFRGMQNVGRLHYWNLTGLHDIEVKQFPIFGHGEKLTGEALQVESVNIEENDDSKDSSNDENIGDIPVEHHDEQEVQEKEPVPSIDDIDAPIEIVTFIPVEHYEEPEVQEEEPVPAIDDNDAAKEIDTYEMVISQVESASAASVVEKVSEPNHSESKDYPDIVSETSEIHSEVFEATNLEAKKAPENDAAVIMDLKDKSDLNSEVADIAEIHTDVHEDLNSEIHEEVYHDIQLKSEEKSRSVEAVAVTSMLVFLSIIAGTAFKWLRKKDEGRRTMANSTSSLAQPHLAKTLLVNQEEETSLEKPSPRNGPTEMDVLGESCPSEMSTFQKSSSYYSQRVLEELNEAQSVEKSSSYYSQRVLEELNEVQSVEKRPKKNYRRESLASSDSVGGSLSYGSFTTYEKLPSKHGYGDAETATPVRRSSRIKNLATSPL